MWHAGLGGLRDAETDPERGESGALAQRTWCSAVRASCVMTNEKESSI